MINLDTRLLDLLNGAELAVFIHILKRIDKTNKSFPSRSTLQKETSFGREKLAASIKGLLEKKVLKSYQTKNELGKFNKTVYIVTTSFASIYVNAKGSELIDDLNRDTENRDTENPLTEKPHLSINHNISIKQIKEYPSSFYQNEIINNQKKTEIINYIKFVEILYGRNEDEEVLKGLLSIKRQVSYKSFAGLIKKSRLKKKYFSQILIKMNNNKRYHKGFLLLSRVIHNWLDNEFK